MIQNIIVRLAAPLALLAYPVSASADSWAMPETSRYDSSNKAFRITIEPAPIDSQLEYFTEELESARTGEPVDRPAPLALLEKATADGFEQVWAAKLVNAVAPVSVFVSNDGQRIATLDNWHSMGFGDNVIVFYDGSGNLLRSMSLTDALPEDYVGALPTSVSSMHWRRSAGFTDDGSAFVIEVVVPGEARTDTGSVPLTISMTDLEVLPLTGEEWEEAREAARLRNLSLKRAEEDRLAFLREPLRTPGDASGKWQDYLREAYFRLTPKYLDGPYPSVRVIDAPGHERHDRSMNWVVEEFTDEFVEDVVIAAPGADASLVEALGRAAAALSPRKLENSVVYASVGAQHADAVRKLVEDMGAQFVWLDPGEAIPQRPERIAGSAEEAAAKQAMIERSAREMAEMLEDIAE